MVTGWHMLTLHGWHCMPAGGTTTATVVPTVTEYNQSINQTENTKNIFRNTVAPDKHKALINRAFEVDELRS